MYPHRIRLRGPWEFEPWARVMPAGNRFALARQGLPAPGRMTVPCRWVDSALGEFKGIVWMRRRFGYPGRIDDFERVWLTVAGLTEGAEVSLNGHALGSCAEADCPCEWEITTLLRERNELALLLTAFQGGGGLWGEVALEIRRTAFLRRVAARLGGQATDQRLTISGEVVGCSERPLELYALLDGRTAAYETVQPSAEGSQFELVAQPDEGAARELPRVAPGQNLRVELVDGGVIWYSVETLAT